MEVENGIIVSNEDVFRKIFENDVNLQNDQDEDDDEESESKSKDLKTKEIPFISKKFLRIM